MSELFVVYEFMPNGSLDKLVFRKENENSPRSVILSWERRHVIIFDVAQALDYLHNGCTQYKERTRTIIWKFQVSTLFKQLLGTPPPLVYKL